MNNLLPPQALAGRRVNVSDSVPLAEHVDRIEVPRRGFSIRRRRYEQQALIVGDVIYMRPELWERIKDEFGNP